MRVFLGLFFFALGLDLLSGDDSLAPCWPLAKGTFWIYEGDVSWVEKNPVTGKNEVNYKHVTWRSEVTDTVENQGTALLHGFPTDLAWYSSQTQPSDTLILLVGTDYYRTATKAVAIFQAIKSPGYRESLHGQGDTNAAELFLPTPLVAGKRFGVANVIAALFTARYCSLVESATPFDLRSVKNASVIEHPLCYSITCHTNPDNSQLDFVPGLGITSYSYLHHGTTMEVNIHLVEFGQPMAVKDSQAQDKVSAPGPD